MGNLDGIFIAYGVPVESRKFTVKEVVKRYDQYTGKPIEKTIEREKEEWPNWFQGLLDQEAEWEEESDDSWLNYHLPTWESELPTIRAHRSYGKGFAGVFISGAMGQSWELTATRRLNLPIDPEIVKNARMALCAIAPPDYIDEKIGYYIVSAPEGG